MRLTRLSVALAAGFALCAAVPSHAGTLDRIKQDAKIRLGYRADARPFSYSDASGNPAGYSVALCHEVVDALKKSLGLADLPVETVKIDADDRFDAISDGKVDLLCGASTATLARREQVDFSLPIFPGGIGALLHRSAPERLKAVLEGREVPYQPRWRASLAQVLEKRTLSAQKGTTAASWLAKKRDQFEVNAEIVEVGSYAEGVDRVMAGKTDVLFGDRAILLESAASSAHPGDLVVLSRQYTYEPIALAFARGDDDFRLLVDRTLSKLYRSGRIFNTYTQYFGEPDDTTQSFFRFVALPD
jgi:ABC-type amino acid transport substrate-binding protein